MKINGESLNRPNTDVVVIPRPEGNDIVFKVQSVLDMDAFEKQFPLPEPTYLRRPGQKEATPNFEDPKYKKAMMEHSANKTKWMFFKSLEATEGLEWETVDLTDPTTWGNIDEELKAAGLNQFEVGMIYSAIMKVNSLDSDYIAEARERFFASQKQESEGEA